MLIKSKINSAPNLNHSSDEIPLGAIYYSNGLIKSIKGTSGSWSTFEYDSKDRLCRITEGDTETCFEYNEDGYETSRITYTKGVFSYRRRVYDKFNRVIHYEDSEGNFWNTSMKPKIIAGFDVRDIVPIEPCARTNLSSDMRVETETNTCIDYSPVSQRAKNISVLKQAEEKIKIILMNLEADTGLSVNFIDVKSEQRFGKPTSVANVNIQLELKP